MLRKPPTKLYVVAWVPLAAVYAALFAAAGIAPASAIRGALALVLPFLLLGFLVLRVPDRVRWDERRRVRFFAIQLALMVPYAVLGAALGVALRYLDMLVVTGRVEGRFEPVIVAWQAVLGSLIYLVIAVGSYAWHNAQRAREADALRTRAELAVLRSQLNPHFLFNTLHASIGLVRRDPALAERALERLGELLRYGLRMHREALDQVRLSEEWEFVRSYLEIESLRLGDRLQLDVTADADAMQCLVPPFVLQPLVENAIVHAIAPRKAGGRLAVSARRRGDRLHLEVSDDGPGLAPSPGPPGRSLGLQLLRERLAMLYPGAAAFSLTPAEGGAGLRALIDLPADNAASAEAR
jgi:two-component system, LytTR family, sensor kinase